MLLQHSADTTEYYTVLYVYGSHSNQGELPCSLALDLHGEAMHMTTTTTEIITTTMMPTTPATAPIIAGSVRVSDPPGGDVLGLLLGLVDGRVD